MISRTCKQIFRWLRGDSDQGSIGPDPFMTLAWIAGRLEMGVPTRVAHLLSGRTERNHPVRILCSGPFSAGKGRREESQAEMNKKRTVLWFDSFTFTQQLEDQNS
jgi:hypothetical protein